MVARSNSLGLLLLMMKRCPLHHACQAALTRQNLCQTYLAHVLESAMLVLMTNIMPNSPHRLKTLTHHRHHPPLPHLHLQLLGPTLWVCHQLLSRHLELLKASNQLAAALQRKQCEETLQHSKSSIIAVLKTHRTEEPVICV